MPLQLRTAERYYRFSEELAVRAVRQARKERTLAAISAVVIAHQATQANEVPAATAAMLAEQNIRAPSSAALIPLAFTTPQPVVEAMLAEIDRETERLVTDYRFERLVGSLVQDAGRAAQVVDVTSRPRVAHVRHLNLPSCSRCAVLAGRVYRYSEGFQRHPQCNCTMTPVTTASPALTYDPAQLARDGLVRGLSRADMQALDDGADFGQVVNIRSGKASVTAAGEVLARRGRLTPAGIYRRSNSREEAVDLLRQAGYLR